MDRVQETVMGGSHAGQSAATQVRGARAHGRLPPPLKHGLRAVAALPCFPLG